MFQAVPQASFNQSGNFQEVHLQASRMLQVLLASSRYFLTELIGCEGLHTGAEQRLAAEKGCIRLAVREHHHVAVIDAIALNPMLVLCLSDKFPVQGQGF